MTVAELDRVWTPHIEREVWLRPGTTDRRVWADTFTGLYHVPPVHRHPATVLDLGANVGLVAAHYRYLWPASRIVSVEMDADNFALAQANAPGVTLAQAAVVPESYRQLRAWYAGEEEDGYHLAPLGPRSAPAITVRELLGWFGVEEVDFVKMDVEGAEWQLLGDAAAAEWAPRVRSLLVEVHGGEGRERMARSLADLGFRATTRRLRHPSAVWAWRP